MKPIQADYFEFPESTAESEDMQTLEKEEYDRICLNTLTYDEEHGLKILMISHEPKPVSKKNHENGENTIASYPLILYVQGSAWMEQNLYTHLFELGEIAKKGFIVAIVQYRSTDHGPFPLQVADSKRALKYLTDHAGEYGIDTENIFLWGDSSGAHTVLMMAVTHNLLFQDFVLPELRGVIDFYGPTNISTMNDFPSTQDHNSPDCPEGRLIGFLTVKEHPELAEKTFVMNYIAEDIPLAPILMFHGTKDRLVPFEQSIELFECLKKHGKDVTFFRLKEADHGGCYFWHETTRAIVAEFLMDHLR